MKPEMWEVFITGGEAGDGKDALGNTVEIPYVMVTPDTNSTSSVIGGNKILEDGCLADFLGIQARDGLSGMTQVKLNIMPFIAFWRVWNEYFRDQNLHPNVVQKYPGIFSATGNITTAVYNAFTTPVLGQTFDLFEMPRVCWEKDYFTSALPFAQRGQPVEAPLTGAGDVTYRDTSNIVRNPPTTAGAASGLSRGAISIANDGGLFIEDAGGQQLRMENIDEVLFDTGGFSINDLRVASRLQEFLEKMARGGARYIEQIKSMFGVTSSDARLQRPEFLGGGKIPVHISEVLQTSETIDGTSTTPQGNMAGHGVAAGKVSGWSTFFEEHCYVLQVIFLRPKTAYQNGIGRMWTQRFDKLDWPWPSFAHLGEQAIKKSEIWWSLDDAEDDEEWGYQQRYAEMKYIPSTVHGEFRHSLDFWHWGRSFGATEPTLSKGFVECDPSPRVFNVVQDTDSLYCIVTNKLKMVRPLPYHGDPHL